MLTKFQKLEDQIKKTQKHTRKCNIRQHYIKCGFELPRLNSAGECGGCYDPDTVMLENECASCQVYECRLGQGRRKVNRRTNDEKI